MPPLRRGSIRDRRCSMAERPSRGLELNAAGRSPETVCVAGVVSGIRPHPQKLAGWKKVRLEFRYSERACLRFEFSTQARGGKAMPIRRRRREIVLVADWVIIALYLFMLRPSAGIHSRRPAHDQGILPGGQAHELAATGLFLMEP